MRRTRRTRCVDWHEIHIMFTNLKVIALEEYRKVKYDYKTNIMDYLDKSKKISYYNDCFEDVEH